MGMLLNAFMSASRWSLLWPQESANGASRETWLRLLCLLEAGRPKFHFPGGCATGFTGAVTVAGFCGGAGAGL